MHAFAINQMPLDKKISYQTFIMIGTLLILFLFTHFGFAEDGIIDLGEDKTAKLVNIANVIKTLQIVAYKWIAPGVGGGLVIYGFYKVALVRESMAGTIAIICGGAMFFIQKIIMSLASLAGD